MSYLLSQLWLCLFVATLLGIFIGWFIRGDSKKKLDTIENRWRTRFSELEYSNQELVKKLKYGNAYDTQYSTIQKRLKRMNRAADLASQQLKYKNEALSKMEQDNELNNIKLMDKESQVNELISQLANAESTQNDSTFKKQSNSSVHPHDQRSSHLNPSKLKQRKKEQQKIPSEKALTTKLEEQAIKYDDLKTSYEKLAKKSDSYKASLIDTESKLQITTAMLEEQQDNK